MRVALCIAGLLVSACTGELSSPFASLESRCAKLSPSRYDVVMVPLEVQETDTADVRELTQRSGSSFSKHRTYGLTTVSFGHETESELRLLEERSSGRTCGTAHVTVRLSMQPAVVYVARELNGDACRHTATRAHEKQHVAVYRAVLGEAADRLRSQLPAAVGTSVLHDDSAAALRVQFDARLRNHLAQFMRTEHAELTARQAQIDTPEEYLRVATACS